MSDDPREFGRKLVEQNPPDMNKVVAEAVTVTLLGRILKMLIEDGYLNRGKVISEIEDAAADFTTRPTGPKAVAYLQIVRDILEGKPEGAPS